MDKSPNPQSEPHNVHYFVDVLVLTIGKIPKIWLWGYMLVLRPDLYESINKSGISH